MASSAKIHNILHELKPTLLMIFVQMVFAMVNIGYKLAAYDGMNLSILVAYRFMFGAAFIVPVAFLAEREKRPKLTKTTVWYGFLCGLFGGSLSQNLLLKCLSLTSATFTTALLNLSPAITFVMAVSFRLEKLAWKTKAGKAKVLGTIMGISGAMLATLYKGPNLNVWNTNINLLEITSTHHQRGQTNDRQGSNNLVVGALYGSASCIFYSLWYIIQAKAAKQFPCPYSITAMMTTWASIQGTVFGLCVERDWSKWILGWDIRLLTVAAAGILGSGLAFPLIAWCVEMRGPLFTTSFSPLMLVMIAVAGSLFLEEYLHLGMVIGGVLIVAGLYFVLWGKAKEMKQISQLTTEIDVEKPTQIEVEPPPNQDSSNHSHGNVKETEVEREEERRDSNASSGILGSVYIYP